SWPIAPDAICDGYATHNYRAAEKGLTGVEILADGSPVPLYRETKTPAERRAYLDERRANPAAHCSRYVVKAKDFAGRRSQCLKAQRRKRRNPLPPLEVARLELEAGHYGDKAA